MSSISAPSMPIASATIARRLIGEKVKQRWPSVAGERLARHRLRHALSRRSCRRRRARARLHAGGAGRGQLAGRRVRTPRPWSTTMRCPCRTRRSTASSSSTASKWRQMPATSSARSGACSPPGGRVAPGRAEPARHLGARRAHALRLRPAVQPRPAHRAPPRSVVLAARLVGSARLAADPRPALPAHRRQLGAGRLSRSGRPSPA